MLNAALTAASDDAAPLSESTTRFAGRPAGEEDDDADEDELEADGAQGLAAAVAGEEDRGRVEQQDERGEHVADGLQEAEARLDGGQLIRAA